MGSFNYQAYILALSTLILSSAMAVDKSRGDIKKETWKHPDRESNPGPPGNKRERYPLRYAAPPLFPIACISRMIY